MKDNKNLENTNEEILVNEENVEAPEITLDELLQDPKIQAQFDKKAEGMKKKWEAAWQKKSEEEKIEAEKLARMSEEEKHQLELSKAIEAQKRAEFELNAYKLKEEALKIANEKELDVSLLNVLDYGKETAESVKTKINDIESSFRKAVEKRVNEVMKQPSPKQFNNDSSSSTLTPDKKNYLDEKYKNNPFYKK